MCDHHTKLFVSLREKGVDLNILFCVLAYNLFVVSLREKGVDLNDSSLRGIPTFCQSPFVRREWI